MSTVSARRLSYRAAVDRATKWMVSHQQADGGFGDVQSLSHYMALPVSLLYVGQPEAAGRLIDYFRKKFVAPDGSFDMPELKAKKKSAIEEPRYAPSWTIYSAHVNLAFDISLRAMPHVLEFQDPVTGGMFGTQEDNDRRKGILDSAVTCVAGQAALTTGYLAEARRMGDHLVRDIIGNNPDLNKAFYPVWDTDRGLRMDAETPSRANMPAALRVGEPNQHQYITGMFISFLTDLYRVTGDRKYLDAAERLFTFAARCAPQVHESTLSHKLAWGLAWLYRVSGRAEQLELACKICDYLVKGQDPDGSFVHHSLISSAECPYSLRMCSTQQFTLWIARVLAVL